MKKKKIVLIIILTMTILLFVGFYFTHNFTGKIIKKYDIVSPFHSISITSHHVVIQTWYGKKDFVINDEEMFNKVNVGNRYAFKKNMYVDWVIVKK